MIKKLEHSKLSVANDIFSIFQNAYKVEAQLIGVEDFPPLSRSAKAIENSTTLFYGFMAHGCLAGVIELEIVNHTLDICSLTVDPAFFRQGIGSKLIDFSLTNFDFSQAVVETAVVNTPAINLYKHHGFVEFKRWTPSHGIEKIALVNNAI